MGQRYAVHFAVEPGEGSGDRGVSLLNQLAETATTWLRERTNHPPVDETTGGWQTDDGRVTVHADRGSAIAVYRFVWTLKRDDSEWTSELQLSTSGDEVDLHAAVHTDQAEDAEHESVRLGLIGELVTRYDCCSMGTRLRSVAESIGEAAVDEFVERRLSLDERVPLVVVSAGRDGRPAIAPSQLQRDLAGLASVYLFDAAASSRLSDRIGRSLSCYAGAVRLYAPGFSDRDRSTQHPFWLANQVRNAARPVWRDIGAQAAQMTVPSSPPLEFFLRQDAIRSAEISRLRDLADEETLAEQVKSLQALVEQERRWREAVIGERDRFQTLYEQAQRLLDAQRSDAEREQSEQDREAGTVSEAVQIAETRRGEHLAFLNSAFTSAEASHYPLPGRALEALSELSKLGTLLATDRVDAEQIVQWLNDRNWECSTESVDTMRRYGSEREFQDETRKRISMPKHVKLGGGSGQDNHLRIHFEWVPEYDSILVGHVGRHLPTGKS